MKFAKMLRVTATELPEMEQVLSCYKEAKKVLKSWPGENISRSFQDGTEKLPDRDFVSTITAHLAHFVDTWSSRLQAFDIRCTAMEEQVTEASARRQKAALHQQVLDFHGECLLMMHWSMLSYTGLVKIMKKYNKRTQRQLDSPEVAKLFMHPFISSEGVQALVTRADLLLTQLNQDLGLNAQLCTRKEEVCSVARGEARSACRDAVVVSTSVSGHGMGGTGGSSVPREESVHSADAALEHMLRSQAVASIGSTKSSLPDAQEDGAAQHPLSENSYTLANGAFASSSDMHVTSSSPRMGRNSVASTVMPRKINCGRVSLDLPSPKASPQGAHETASGSTLKRPCPDSTDDGSPTCTHEQVMDVMDGDAVMRMAKAQIMLAEQATAARVCGIDGIPRTPSCITQEAVSAGMGTVGSDFSEGGLWRLVQRDTEGGTTRSVPSMITKTQVALQTWAHLTQNCRTPSTLHPEPEGVVCCASARPGQPVPASTEL